MHRVNLIIFNQVQGRVYWHLIQPILDNSFYITYERDPILYTYQLLDDFKEGDLQIMEGFSDPPSLDIDLELVSLEPCSPSNR